MLSAPALDISSSVEMPTDAPQDKGSTWSVIDILPFAFCEEREERAELALACALLGFFLSCNNKTLDRCVRWIDTFVIIVNARMYALCARVCAWSS